MSLPAAFHDAAGGRNGRWPLMLGLSGALHVAVFAGSVILPHLVPSRAGGPPVYVVDLVALPAGAMNLPPRGGAATAPKPPPQPPPKPEKAIPIPERKAKPESKKVPKPGPRATPAPPKPEAAPPPTTETPDATAPVPDTGAVAAAAGARAGGMGGTGTGQADAATFYGGLLRRRIEGAWVRPLFPPNWSSNQPPTATVRITLTSSGRVTSLTLSGPSGYEAMDQSIMHAVRDAQPFPPFPSQLGRDVLSVTIDFVLPPK